MVGLYLTFVLVLLTVLVVLLWPIIIIFFRPPPHPSPLRGEGVFILSVAAFFVIGAFGLYRLLGAPEIVPLLAARQEKLAGIRTVIVRRAQEVKADPKNLAAWIELGRSFMETGQYSAAANAFKQAVLLSQGNPTLILAFAQAQIAEADGKVTDDAKKGLEMVLLQQPDNAEARYWLAVRQLQDGHTQEAMQAMKALYRELPTDSEIKERIDRQIGRKP